MKELWVPLSAAIAQQNKLDVHANNVANANTPGFKKDDIVFKEYLTVLNKNPQNNALPRKTWAPKDFYNSQGAHNAQVKIDGTYTRFEQGQLRPTKNPLDFAISGKGMFEVLSDKGVRYTRRGDFSLSAKGQIVNSNGEPLLKKGKGPPETRMIKIPNSLGPRDKLSLSSDGKLFAGERSLGKISTVHFKDLHTLKKMGNGQYFNKFPENIVEKGNSQILQGMIEESNVNAIAEMTELIKAHRHFESIQNVIKTYDQISSKSVNEIAKF